jgi:capsular exopolysaccharide synthesis family protein
VIDQSGPVVVEAIREVAANLTFASKAQNARVLAVVSAETGDGRSDLVANAGVALAKMWHDVVLIDADLRKPSLHHYFGLSNSVGLSNFVANAEMEISDVIQETSYPRLKVITSGSLSADPVELLASPRTKGLLEQLENLASIVLVDTPPLKAAVDGVILASQVQGLVLLVNGESSRSETMKRALATLEKTGAPLLGYVWSKINLKRLDNYSSGRRYFQSLKQDADLYAGPEDQLEMTGRKSQTNGTGVGRGSGFKMGKGIWRRVTGVTKVFWLS